MQKFRVTIKSKSPYMQDRMDDIKLANWEKIRSNIIERDGINQEIAEKAEFACYRNEAGKCYIPVEQLRASMIAAGTMTSAKVGARSKSMKTTVAGMFFVISCDANSDQIEIPDYDQIDSRSITNMKARVMKYRPKWSTLNVTFEVHVDNDGITKEMVQKIISDAGSYMGIGSFRPTNSGLFGRFEVVKFDVIP